MNALITFQISKGLFTLSENRCNKKAFQSKANSPSSTVRSKLNKFKQVREGPGPCIMRFKLNKFEHVGDRALFSEVHVDTHD